MTKPRTPEGFPDFFVEGSHGEHLIPLFRSLKRYVPEELRAQWQEETCLVKGADGKLSLQVNGHPPTWGPAVTESIKALQKKLHRPQTGRMDIWLIGTLGKRRHEELLTNMLTYSTERATMLLIRPGIWYNLRPSAQATPA